MNKTFRVFDAKGKDISTDSTVPKSLFEQSAFVGMEYVTGGNEFKITRVRWLLTPSTSDAEVWLKVEPAPVW